MIGETNRKHLIERDAERCVRCLECILVCPQSSDDRADSVIVRAPHPEDPPVINEMGNCIQCMSCVDFCRANAILFRDYHEVKILLHDVKMQEKVARII